MKDPERLPPVAADTIDTAAQVEPGRTSMFAAFRYRDYRLFWMGHTVSNIGTWMEMLGQGWLVVLLAISDGSPQLAPFYLGLVGLARAVPGLGLSLIAGAVADRSDRRQLLLITQVAACLLALLLGTLVATNTVTVAAVVLIATIRSSVFSFDVPSRQSLVPRLVPRHHLMSAIGLNQASFNGPQIVGPALGGILIGVTGSVAPLFFVNAATYLAVVIALVLMSSTPVAPQRDRPSVGRSVLEGVSYMRRDQVIKWSVVLSATLAFFARPYIFLLPAFAANVLAVGATELSWIMAATGIGGLTGSLLVANLGGVRRRGRLQLAFIAASGLSLMHFTVPRDMAFALVAALLVGLTTIAFNGVTNTVLQTTAPDRMLGRVMSVFALLFMGVMPLGQLALGTLGSAFGIDVVLFTGGAVTLGAGLYGFVRLPHIRDLRARGRVVAHPRSEAAVSAD
ncbi:MAG: MFS transporter [Candidatus Limnocylindria bacterium]